MEIGVYLQFGLFGLCIIGTICILIITLKDKNEINYDKLIKELNFRKENDLKKLKLGEQKIDEMEKNIRELKKELHKKKK